MAPYGMLTELQTIFLTCLLGPEDKTGFRKFQARKRSEKWVEANPEARREHARRGAAKWRRENPEVSKERAKQWRKDNILKARATYQKTKKKRYHSDPNFKLRVSLSNRLNKVLRLASGVKSGRATELLGCSLDELRAHLEFNFKSGMTWENHGPVWHVDHIKPCAKFDLTNPEQQKSCFHWTNLQPLFAKENMSKRDKYVV